MSSYEGVRVKYTPTKTGVYCLVSISETQPSAVLYDSEGEWLASDDDSYGNGYSENDMDFCLCYTFEAGETYYFGIYDSYYSEDTSITFDIYLTECAIVGAPDSVSPEVKVVGTTDNTTYQWYEGTYDEESDLVVYEKMTGETAATLQSPEIGYFYYCEINVDGELTLTGTPFYYDYELISVPTSKNPTIVFNDDKGLTYEWYEYEGYINDPVELTDENADEGYYEYHDKYSSYDETVGWIPATGGVVTDISFYKHCCFEFSTDSPCLIYLEPSEELCHYIEIEGSDRFYGYTPNDVYDNGQYVVEIPEAGTYTVWLHSMYEDLTVKASVNEAVNNKLSDETTATLTTLEVGKTYRWVVKNSDGEVMWDDKFDCEYAITKEPTESEPYVTTNASDDVASYQWYKVTASGQEITDKTAETISRSLYGETSVYTAEKGWHGLKNYYYNPELGLNFNGYMAFEVDLKAGDVITLYATDCMDIENWNDVSVWNVDTYDEVEVTEVSDGIYTCEIEEDGTYLVEYYSIENDTYLRAYKGALKLEAIATEKAATLSTKENGMYLCEVTFKDGTVKRSNIVYLASEEAVTPDTGDSSYTFVWMSLLLMGCAGTVAVSGKKRFT